MKYNDPDEGTGTSCSSSLSYVNSILAGYEWQCVELINRLYLSRGWTSQYWSGNGDTMLDHLPSGITKQSNGSITYLNPGDVVSIGDSTQGTAADDGGHILVVNSVSGSAVQLVSQNASDSTPYAPATLSGGTLTIGWSGWHVIGVAHHPGSALTDGSFVSYQGNVYRIAGGAPIYVSSWNAFGGPQPTTALTSSQWASLRQYPADGTFVAGTGTGYVYRFAGGAPIYVSNWNNVGGSQPAVVVDQAAIDNADGPSPWNHVRANPADGTFVAAGGFVYRFAGGAPIYVSNWNNVGGPQPSTEEDPVAIAHADGPRPWNHVRQYPADGTFVAAGGYIYRFAGGAPLYVSNWNAVGGPQPSTEEDPVAIANADEPVPWNHVRAYPANGTFVVGGGTNSCGCVYEFAGGAPIYVASWNDVGGSKPSTLVDQSALENGDGPVPWNHVHRYPANGTFLSVLSGAAYRVAGGAALPIPSWSPFGGPQASTQISQAAISDAGGAIPWNHLIHAPVNGTLLEGLPSGQYWLINAGCRGSVAAAGGAVGINDATIAAIPLCVATLSVAKSGTGSGTVTSSPAGINCGFACSHSYAQGTSVTLTATPSADSTFGGWSGACTGTATCKATLSGVRSVSALFVQDCVVPSLRGKTLRTAKSLIATDDCTLGTIRHTSSTKTKKGRVISQRPKPGSRLGHDAKVNLVVSRGKH